MPDLDEHDLTHLDAYTAATRLVINGRQTPTFTVATRPPRPVVCDATALRRHVAARGPSRDGAALDDLVRRTSTRNRRTPRT
jgi:hypothetical protein